MQAGHVSDAQEGSRKGVLDDLIEDNYGAGNTGGDLDATVEGVHVPRRQRGTRRRLAFPARAAPPEKRRETDRSAMERRTSGIYDLIDAIGLLGPQPCLPGQ